MLNKIPTSPILAIPEIELSRIDSTNAMLLENQFGKIIVAPSEQASIAIAILQELQKQGKLNKRQMEKISLISEGLYAKLHHKTSN